MALANGPRTLDLARKKRAVVNALKSNTVHEETRELARSALAWIAGNDHGYRLKPGAPAWVGLLIADAAEDLDRGLDTWRMRQILEALVALADATPGSNVDDITPKTNLTADELGRWILSDQSRINQCIEAAHDPMSVMDPSFLAQQYEEETAFVVHNVARTLLAVSAYLVELEAGRARKEEHVR